jgi:hypothetical protein
MGIQRDCSSQVAGESSRLQASYDDSERLTVSYVSQRAVCDPGNVLLSFPGPFIVAQR